MVVAIEGYLFLGQDMECRDCGKTIQRTSFSQIRCPECAEKIASERCIIRKQKQRDARRAELSIFPRPPRAKEPDVVGHVRLCQFCGRRPSSRTIFSTEKIDGVKFWRCIC